MAEINILCRQVNVLCQKCHFSRTTFCDAQDSNAVFSVSVYAFSEFGNYMPSYAYLANYGTINAQGT